MPKWTDDPALWNRAYRRLDEGEIIRSTDECLTDSHLGWRADNGRCAGKPAPSPLYSSHRIYRRKRRFPMLAVVCHWVRVIHAKAVFARTKQKARRQNEANHAMTPAEVRRLRDKLENQTDAIKALLEVWDNATEPSIVVNHIEALREVVK